MVCQGSIDLLYYCRWGISLYMNVNDITKMSMNYDVFDRLTSSVSCGFLLCQQQNLSPNV